MPLMVDADLSIGTPEALWLDFDGRRRRFAQNSSSTWLASCSPLLGENQMDTSKNSISEEAAAMKDRAAGAMKDKLGEATGNLDLERRGEAQRGLGARGKRPTPW